MQKMDRYEDAYLSFSQALSIPTAKKEGESNDIVYKSYCKLILMNIVVHLYSGEPNSEGNDRSNLSFKHKRHFIPQYTL